MKKIIVLMVALFLNWNSSAQVSDSARISARDIWLRAVYDICEKTHDSEAMVVYNRLCESVPVKFSENFGFENLFSCASSNTLNFMPVMFEDIWAYKYRDMMAVRVLKNPNNSAFFWYDAIYVRAYMPYTNFRKGMTLIHEGSHALRKYLVLSFSDNGHAQEEVAAYELEFRVARLYVGHLYEAALQNEVKRMCDTMQVRGVTTFDKDFDIVPIKKFYPELDTIMPLPLSGDERVDRDYEFWIAATFRFIEQNAPAANVSAYKEDFISKLYQHLSQPKRN